MANEEKSRKQGIELPHNVILEDRSKLSVSGVEDVESFDESIIIMVTSEGTLTVRGTEMHIDKLNLENGELSLAGDIQAMEYDDNVKSHGGFLGKLFG